MSIKEFNPNPDQWEVIQERSAQIHFDPLFKHITFSLSQKNEILKSLADESIDCKIVKSFMTNHDVASRTMHLIRVGAQAGLTFDKLRFLFMFRKDTGEIANLLKNLLVKKIATLQLLERILIEDGKVAQSKYLNSGRYRNCFEIADQIEIVNVTEKFLIDAKRRDDFIEMINSKSLRCNRELLALYTKLTKNERLDCFDQKIAKNVIFCYVYCNKTDRTWRQVRDFNNLHPNAENYILAFLKGLLDDYSNEELSKLFDLDSNRLIDELFFEHHVSLDEVWQFEGYENLNHNTGTNHKYSGYSLGLSDEPVELARCVVKWLDRGKSIDKIIKFTSANFGDKVSILDLGMTYKLTVDQAIDMFKTLCENSVFGKRVGSSISVKVIKDKIHEIQFVDNDGIIDRIRDKYVPRTIIKDHILKRAHI